MTTPTLYTPPPQPPYPTPAYQAIVQALFESGRKSAAKWFLTDTLSHLPYIVPQMTEQQALILKMQLSVSEVYGTDDDTYMVLMEARDREHHARFDWSKTK